MTEEYIMDLVIDEYTRATKAHGRFLSAHEGFAILYEEVDELWEAVRIKQSDAKHRDEELKKEAVQVAAMAFRFLHDICGVQI